MLDLCLFCVDMFLVDHWTCVSRTRKRSESPIGSMAKMNLLIFISVTVLISGSLSADSENERGTENQLREILGLHERRNAPISRNNNGMNSFNFEDKKKRY